MGVLVAPARGQLPAQGPLTIYSSLPLQGDARPQSEDVFRAMRMALEEAGGRAGGRQIRYVSLDSATARTGTWDPGRVSANARRAVSDDSTIAYLGEFNSGASAISIPILNVGEILQISPSNTYVGLTRSQGAERHEPDRYYPSGIRTYGRVIPADHTQAGALCSVVGGVGSERLAIVHDNEVYGAGIARLVRRCAARVGSRVVAFLRMRRRTSPAAVAARVRRARPDAMVYGGITQNRAPALWRAVHRRNPRIWLLGGDGVAESAFSERIPRASRRWTRITNPAMPARAYPPAGQEFFRRFRGRFGKQPEPYAIYGYEAMALALDAVNRGGATRRGALDAFFTTRDRKSVLGRYSIDANGDTTLADYGVFRVTRGGGLAFDQKIQARP